jgi:hypothetical protein
MSRLARLMRAMTHLNVGATLALMTWLASTSLPGGPR